MKITKKEAQRISENYRLGNVINIKYIPAGWVNFSYNLKTDKGNFIVQVLNNFDKYKEVQMKKQFQVLEFLNRSDFSYEVPIPLTTKSRKHFMKVKGKSLWVYRRIEGSAHEKVNMRELKKLGKTMAIYNKYMKKFPKGDKSNFNVHWLMQEYRKMKNVRPKNKLDRLMLKNFNFFNGIVSELDKLDWGNNFIFAHADLTLDNTIFRKGRIVGIIDFNNMEYAPLSQDIVVALLENCIRNGRINKKRYDTILNSYNSVSRLSKKDKGLILPLILRYYCFLFRWHYKGMEKHKELQYSAIEDDVASAKKVYDIWKK